jgi:hypothetical protein
MLRSNYYRTNTRLQASQQPVDERRVRTSVGALTCTELIWIGEA